MTYKINASKNKDTFLRVSSQRQQNSRVLKNHLFANQFNCTDILLLAVFLIPKGEGLILKRVWQEIIFLEKGQKIAA